MIYFYRVFFLVRGGRYTWVRQIFGIVDYIFIVKREQQIVHIIFLVKNFKDFKLYAERRGKEEGGFEAGVI